MVGAFVAVRYRGVRGWSAWHWVESGPERAACGAKFNPERETARLVQADVESLREFLVCGPCLAASREAREARQEAGTP